MQSTSKKRGQIDTAQFPYITKAHLDYLKRNRTHKTERGFINHLSKINADHEARATRPDVKQLRIIVTWKNSRVWGWCPTATAEVLTEANGWQFVEGYFRAGGCGYDKFSTVVADVCNVALSGMLYRRRRARKPAPYGIQLKSAFFPYFVGGIGISCYREIARFLGGKMEHIDRGTKCDIITFTF